MAQGPLGGRLAGAGRAALGGRAARLGGFVRAASQFLILCALVLVVGMLSPHLTPHSAGVVALVGAIAVIAGAVVFVVFVSSLPDHVGETGAARVAEGFILTLRRLGVPLIALGFFLLWTFVYCGIWWYAPADAFRGLGPVPRFADFFYYSVSTALISPPGDITAHSRGARSATMIEMLSGISLLTAYLTSFAGDWFRREAPAEDAEAEPGREPPAPS